MRPVTKLTAPSPAADLPLSRALEALGRTQDVSGSWKGDYGGPLFLVPVYVFGMVAVEAEIPADVREGIIRYLRHHQNPDGGWGLDVESHSHVFTTVNNYVAMRLLGVPAEDPGLLRARHWFLPRGGPVASASWGKFFLAMMGLYDYRGLNALLPELWLLPTSVPFHPSKLWCHCRMVYLPMSYLYGRRFVARETPLLAAIRAEIYDQPYAEIDWAKARDHVSPTDSYTPHSPLLKAGNAAMNAYEARANPTLRKKALEEVLEQIHGEDEATHYICIGPINKMLNLVAWHDARPGGDEVHQHLKRVPEYLYRAADGIKMQGYNSSQLWDTAFVVQALLEDGDGAAGDAVVEQMLQKAARFIDENQVLEDSPNKERFYRHASRGGWPFSTRDHGWPISDCTGEGLKAAILLEQRGISRISRDRLHAAVDLILSMQNEDGGWATYELTRAPRWVEQLNPSDVFSTIMTDVSYVECTTSCLTALAAWSEHAGDTHGSKLRKSIERGEAFLRGIQRPDGSFEGSWGVCFSYGTWFGIKGLLAAGARPSDPAVEKAARYLLGKQRADGSWSEMAESCRQRTWVEGEHGHVVNTCWALLGLVHAGYGRSQAVARGVAWLKGQQREDGTWPDEPLAGVFNKTCAIHYDAYLKLFPVWALRAAEQK